MKKFYKITSRNEVHHKMKYKTGLNEDVLPFRPIGNCEPGGIYFAKEDILSFLNYGPWIREVVIPDGEEVYRNPGTPVKFKAHRVILGKRRRIDNEVINDLIAEGAKVRRSFFDWIIAYDKADLLRFHLTKTKCNLFKDVAECNAVKCAEVLLEAGFVPRASHLNTAINLHNFKVAEMLIGCANVKSLCEAASVGWKKGVSEMLDRGIRHDLAVFYAVEYHGSNVAEMLAKFGVEKALSHARKSNCLETHARLEKYEK